MDRHLKQRRMDHAMGKARERCGVHMTQYHYDQLHKKLRNFEGHFLYVDPHKPWVTHWALEYKGSLIHTVYNTQDDLIVTFLDDFRLRQNFMHLLK